MFFLLELNGVTKGRSGEEGLCFAFTQETTRERTTRKNCQFTNERLNVQHFQSTFQDILLRVTNSFVDRAY